MISRHMLNTVRAPVCSARGKFSKSIDLGHRVQLLFSSMYIVYNERTPRQLAENTENTENTGLDQTNSGDPLTRLRRGVTI